MKQRWVVVTFFPEGIYNTTTFDTVEEAYALYQSFVNRRDTGCYNDDKKRRYALILDGSELPIKGYKPGKIATGAPYEEAK